jgi:hypothetical protein
VYRERQCYFSCLSIFLLLWHMRTDPLFGVQSQFGARLRGALMNAGCSISPTTFAREFNLRCDGFAITPHAARKWLEGRSIPTQGKLILLARWLLLSPEWLRYGSVSGACDHTVEQGIVGITSADVSLLRDLHRLDGKSRAMVGDLIALLLRNATQSEFNQ